MLLQHRRRHHRHHVETCSIQLVLYLKVTSKIPLKLHHDLKNLLMWYRDHEILSHLCDGAITSSRTFKNIFRLLYFFFKIVSLTFLMIRPSTCCLFFACTYGDHFTFITPTHFIHPQTELPAPRAHGPRGSSSDHRQNAQVSLSALLEVDRACKLATCSYTFNVPNLNLIKYTLRFPHKCIIRSGTRKQFVFNFARDF